MAAYNGLGSGAALGTLTNTGGGAFALTSASDLRLKKNVRDTKYSGLSIINEIRVRDYEWKKNNITNTSFIAQELAKIYPNAVVGDETKFDGKTMIGEPLMVANTNLIPILVKSIQELSQEVRDLKTQLNK